MSPSPPEYIRHILDEIDYILSRISDRNYESLLTTRLFGMLLQTSCLISVQNFTPCSNKSNNANHSMNTDIERAAGSRRRVAVETRGAISWIAFRELGYSGAEVARYLGVTTSYVTRLVAAGKNPDMDDLIGKL